MPGFRLPIRGAAILVAVFVATACGGDEPTVETLNIEVRGPQDGPETETIGFPQAVDYCVNRLRITSFQGDRAVDQAVFPWDASPGRMPRLRFGPDTWLSVEGLSGGQEGCASPDEVVASGATTRFELSESDTAPPRTTVFTGLPNRFESAFWYSREDDRSIDLLYDLPDHRRAGHTITELADGSGYLVVGGARMGSDEGIAGSGIDSLVDTVEFYDAYTGKFWSVYDDACSSSGPECALKLPGGTAFHTATALPDGRVLVVGGLRLSPEGSALWPTADVVVIELTGYAEGHIDVVPYAADAFPQERAFHTATPMGDGRVVIVGGIGRTFGPNPTFQADIHQILPGDPLEVSDAGIDLAQPRALHTATYFGRNAHGVIVVGGRGQSGLTAGSEVIYSISSNPSDPLALDRLTAQNTDRDLQVARFGHDAVSFSCPGTDAEYLAVVGGYTVPGGGILEGSAPTATVEVYDPDARFDGTERYAFTSSTSELKGGGRAFGEAIALPISGDVLYAGGIDASGNVTAAADRLRSEWDPCASLPDQLMLEIPEGMRSPRAHAASIILGGGFAFVTGGFDGTGSTETSEFFNPNDYGIAAGN